MRGARSLLVLVVVLGALGAYIYFVESKKPAGEAAESRPKVFSVTADKIAEIAIKAGSGEHTTVRKAGSTWEIVEPVTAPADEAEVSGITTNLATVENARVVDENAKDLAQYGLAAPRVDVAFKTAGDQGYRHLLIGDKTATGGELYAKLGNDNKVFLIAAFLESTFNRTTFDLRDKSLLQFARDKVDRLELQAGKDVVQLALANAEWTLTRPIQAPADYGVVEGLIGRLLTGQMKAIVSQEAKDPKAYGLDKPQFTATVGLGSSQATLFIGGQAEDGTLYAKDASRPMVFTVEAGLLEEVKKPADQLRKKDLFASRPYNTSRVEVVRGGDTLVFERVAGQGDAGGKWRQTRPATRDADASKVEMFLTKLSNLRAESWLEAEAAGQDVPLMAVTVGFEDGKRQEKVAFSRRGGDVLATASGQPGIAKVVSAELDEALKALDAAK